LWIADFTDGDGVWKKVEVKENLAPNADKVKVIVPGTNEEVQVSVKDPMFLSNADVWSNSEGLIGVQDLASLMHLHEPEVLETLQLRFDVDQIYTFCGGILIAVNPFKGIKGLYEPTTLTKVVEAELRGDSVPHIFTIASRTLNNLNRYRESQVVLISGESGAGKTETTKHVLKFLSETMGGASESGGASPRRVSKIKTESVSTEQKILNSNPLLEAFGNACTVRNNNSSRFGKFIEMRFQETKGTASFVGACIDTYLLEKVRVTEVTENKPKAPAKGQQPKTPKQERSYHIFYQVCAAAKKLGQDAFGLPMNWFDDADKYNYLNKSPLRTLPGCDDANEFSETVKAMQTLGMSPENMAAIIKIVAAVLNLGNVEVEGDGESSKVKQGNKYFESVAQLLKIDRKVLQRALTFRFIQVSKTEKYDKPLRQKEAEDAREALARALYGALFLYIVEQVNISLAGVDMSNTQSYIGVLDIFGFESFETNSFEQLCINFANERLQKLFNDFVFLQEMKLYESEGVECDRAEFPDNSDIINLVQGKAPKTSIFTMLDEECRVPGGHDQGFCDKARKEFAQTTKNPRFEANPRYQSTFTIRHFAGPVTYECARFLDKNNDEIGDLLKDALASSEEPFVTETILGFMGGAGEKASGKMKKMTVSAFFKGQLESLMNKLSKAQPHFVRCLKPNPENLPGRLNRRTVVEQLRSGGVIEALRVQRSGFPCRVLLESESAAQEAWKDFLRILVTKEERVKFLGIPSAKERTQKALEAVAPRIPLKKDANGTTYAVGRTRVFFKQAAFESLEGAVKHKQHEAATYIQKSCKRNKFYLIYMHIKHLIIMIQSNFRGHLHRRRLWDAATQQQRATSLIFKRYRSEEDEEAAQELLAAAMEAERLKLEAEEEERKRIKAEADARIRAEEEKRREEERKRKEEEERRMAEMKRKAEEERKKVEEERRKVEEQRKKLADAEGKVSDLTTEMRKLQGEIEAAKHETEMVKVEHEQKLTLAAGQEKSLQARIAELERENARLRGEVDEYLGKITALQQARDRELAAVVASQDEVRIAATSQVDALKAALEEKHAGYVNSLKEREGVLQDRFKEQANLLRDHQLKQAQRHSEELQKLKDEQGERQSKFEAEILQAMQRADDSAADKQILEQQVANLKRDNDRMVSMMQTQAEETKRMYTSEIKLMQERFTEREKTLMEELDLVHKQRDDQMAAFNGQLESQKEALLSSCRQEVEFVKKQSEQREKSLMQMLDRARDGETDKAKSFEVKLTLKDKQAAEMKRCLEAKCQHLEESNRRSQELYDQHVEQLTRQLNEKESDFANQMQMQEEAAAMQLAEVTGEFRALEARVKVEREQQQATMKAVQGAAPENKKLKEQLKDAHKEISQLKTQLIDARGRLKAKMEAEKQQQEEAANAAMRPTPTARRPSLRRQSSARQSIMPPKIAPPAWGPAQGARKLARTRTLDMSAGMGATMSSMKPLESLAPGRSKFTAMMSMKQPTQTRDVEYELLRPSQTRDGQECTGKIAPWTNLTVDSAVTVICLGSIPLSTTMVCMAVATQSGSLYTFHVLANYMDADEGDITPVQKLQFKAHSKAITFMCFGLRQDELVTSSSDFRVRVWSVKDGTMLHETIEGSLVACALPLRVPEGGLVVASEGAKDMAPLLRLCVGQDQIQKVRLEHSARSLVADVSGKKLLAGSSKGMVFLFEVTDEKIEQTNKLQATHGAISCLTIGEPGDGSPPLVVANSADSTVCVMQANNNITNLTVLRRITNPHKILPIRNCYVPVAAAAGFIVSGAEEPELNIYDMEYFGNYKLKAHKVPVVGAAVTEDSTLLATGDVRGSIVLWRRALGL